MAFRFAKIHRFGSPGAPCGLWLHGWLGSGAEGAGLFGPGDLDHALLCPDLPGHGGSPPDTDREGLLLAIAELAQGCRWAAGYSMGGRLLMMAAATHPDAFDRLILESASLGLTDPAARAERARVDRERAERLRTVGVEAFCREWYAQPMWGGFTDFPPRSGDPFALATSLETFSLSRQPDLRPWLIRTPCRVLWLAGARDPAYVSQARWVREHTRARVRIADTGHNIHAQDPAAWRSAVASFESETETTTS